MARTQGQRVRQGTFPAGTTKEPSQIVNRLAPRAPLQRSQSRATSRCPSKTGCIPIFHGFASSHRRLPDGSTFPAPESIERISQHGPQQHVGRALRTCPAQPNRKYRCHCYEESLHSEEFCLCANSQVFRFPIGCLCQNTDSNPQS